MDTARFARGVVPLAATLAIVTAPAVPAQAVDEIAKPLLLPA